MCTTPCGLGLQGQELCINEDLERVRGRVAAWYLAALNTGRRCWRAGWGRRSKTTHHFVFTRLLASRRTLCMITNKFCPPPPPPSSPSPPSPPPSPPPPESLLLHMKTLAMLSKECRSSLPLVLKCGDVFLQWIKWQFG